MSDAGQGEGVSRVTPPSLAPLLKTLALENVMPEIAPSLRELREQWIEQFEVRTAPEMLILDQALLAYAYGLRMNQGLFQTPSPDEPGQAAAEAPAGSPTPKAPPGLSKKARRQLDMVVRLNRMFVRNLNAMKKWRSMDLAYAVNQGIIDSWRK